MSAQSPHDALSRSVYEHALLLKMLWLHTELRRGRRRGGEGGDLSPARARELLNGAYAAAGESFVAAWVSALWRLEGLHEVEDEPLPASERTFTKLVSELERMAANVSVTANTEPPPPEPPPPEPPPTRAGDEDPLLYTSEPPLYKALWLWLDYVEEDAEASTTAGVTSSDAESALVDLFPDARDDARAAALAAIWRMSDKPPSEPLNLTTQQFMERLHGLKACAEAMTL